MPNCTRCGERMTHNDETTKLTEYTCSGCHWVEIVHKEDYRITT